MLTYGTPDEDTTAYDVLIKHIEGKDVKYILHHPRMPIDARACKLPLSLRVQAVLTNNVVVTSMQPAPGKPARIQ